MLIKHKITEIYWLKMKPTFLLLHYKGKIRFYKGSLSKYDNFYLLYHSTVQHIIV